MIDNTGFKRALENAGISMYELSRLSAVPYTTVNEIHNGKLDINQCAAGTVKRLSAILGVSVDEILNPIMYLNGVKGKYKGIEYVWSTDLNDGCSQITFEYEGRDVTLSTGAVYNIPSRIRYYNTMAGWNIKHFIEHMEWEERAKEIIAGRAR